MPSIILLTLRTLIGAWNAPYLATEKLTAEQNAEIQVLVFGAPSSFFDSTAPYLYEQYQLFLV